jgi:hypothetical protein
MVISVAHPSDVCGTALSTLTTCLCLDGAPAQWQGPCADFDVLHTQRAVKLASADTISSCPVLPSPVQTPAAGQPSSPFQAGVHLPFYN